MLASTSRKERRDAPVAAPAALRRPATCAGSAAARSTCPGDPAYDDGTSALEPPGRRPPSGRRLPGVPRRGRRRGARRRRRRPPVAPQGTGHGAPPLDGRLGDAVLLRTSAMAELRIDADARTARVGAGVLWGDLIDARRRRTAWPACTPPRPTSASSATPSAAASAGTRRLASACSATRSPQSSWCSPTARSSEPPTSRTADLFWAARGGGGRFGVVTALEFDLFPIDRVVAGLLAWDWTAAEQVLAPGRLVRRRPGRGDQRRSGCSTRPTSHRCRPDCAAATRVVDGAVLGDDAGPPRCSRRCARCAPEIDTFDASRRRRWSGCTSTRRDRRRLREQHPGLRRCPDAVEALVDGRRAAAPARRLLFAELRQLGGALARPRRAAAPWPGSTARSSCSRRARARPGGWTQQREDAERFLAAVEPWATGRCTCSMLDDQATSAAAVPPRLHARLSEIRAQRPTPTASSWRRTRLSRTGWRAAQIEPQVGLKSLATAGQGVRGHGGRHQHRHRPRRTP